VLAAVLVAQVLYVDLSAVGSVTTDGVTRRMVGAFGGPDKTSMLVNLLFAVLLVETLQRSVTGERMLATGNANLGACLVIALFGVYVTDARNALVELLGMSLAVFAAAVYANRDRLRRSAWAAAIALALVAPLALGVISVKQDLRWQGFAESVAIAWDTHTHRAWLDIKKHPLPHRANGQVVDESTYLRAAWLKEGAVLVAEHPWGIGYGRAAFGRGLQLKYGEGKGNHSHSGLLDMAIQAGIPAALLWLALLTSLLALALRSYRQNRSFPALLLLAIVAGFSIRMLLDSNIRDHMFKQFMFLTGILAVMTATPIEPRPQAGRT
jgi:O-antigen ligase